VNKKTLAEQVFDILYDSIINGEIEPGQELVEHQLSKSLQVSRTPIREAFSRLKAMGLVEGNSYSKVTVKGITPEEIDEVTDIRTLLEIYTMKYTVENCTPKDIKELEEILEESYQYIKSGDYKKAVAINTRFHETLNRISGKKNAIRMLASLRDILYRHRVFGMTIKEYNMRNYDSHKRIIEALKRKDTKAAIEEITRHMQQAKEASMEGLNKLAKSK